MAMPAQTPPPVILMTSGTVPRERGLRRNDTVQGHNYALALTSAGAVPLLAPNVDAGLAEVYAERADGLLLTGGVDIDPYLFGARPHPDLGTVDRRRDAFELALYRAFRALGKPILGICRGIQLVNVAHGGTLHQHLPAVPDTEQHLQKDFTGAPLQRVALTPGSRLAAGFGSTDLFVNSFHHQAVDSVGEGLQVTARSEDGVVEALEIERGGDGADEGWRRRAATTSSSRCSGTPRCAGTRTPNITPRSACWWRPVAPRRTPPPRAGRSRGERRARALSRP